MKVYTVRILDTVFADIGDIADYIVAVSTPEHAAKYARQLQAEQWCEAVLHWCKCLLQRCEAIFQRCNAPCNDARPFYRTARGFCDDARRNCTETVNFRRSAGNKIRRAAFVLVINFKWFMI